MTVAGQAQAFAAMMLCGAGIGAAHDLLIVFRQSTIWTAAADLALGLLGAAAVIAAGLLLRCEPFRMYTFLGFSAGWAVYALSLGTIVRVVMRFFIKLSKKLTN